MKYKNAERTGKARAHSSQVVKHGYGTLLLAKSCSQEFCTSMHSHTFLRTLYVRECKNGYLRVLRNWLPVEVEEHTKREKS